MPRMLFLNLPVADLERSKAFYAKLGFAFDPAFSDDSATMMIVEPGSTHVMLLERARFAGFSAGPVGDPWQTTDHLIAISADDRAAVDAFADAARDAGAAPWKEPMDMGEMYGRSFRDPDGHVWEVVWMSEAAVRSAQTQAEGAGAAS